METNIKLVGLADLTELCNISRETFKDTFGDDNTDDDMQKYFYTAYNLEQLKSEMEKRGTSFWFLSADGKLAGYLKINIGHAQSENVAPNALEIERIYIYKQYKHHGFGTLFINHAQTIADIADKDKIWLGVWEHNEAAKHFYAKLGFKQIGDHVFQLGNDEQRDLVMIKSLV
ncbi:acetyltransferase [Paucilactobacillus hokkaidonensis JCM 18461]|uniref:Acetyltransferase n=1 Tax=Paucilactobacillus hokkaidonensis JCM 18461 TaxID=1291742 RepID=A0A0A1GWE3_9LACO|nr:GNAT family N-acetyltransferase [Paucilactobacillus hokkaidonensis]BAP86335.1 acetyltransferase [Paucilactobacillus hokkaidonensis JCM 18461]